jgi:hypothetical protein
LLFVVCVLALVVVVWLVPQVPLSLVIKVIIKVTLAYLAICWGYGCSEEDTCKLTEKHRIGHELTTHTVRLG